MITTQLYKSEKSLNNTHNYECNGVEELGYELTPADRNTFLHNSFTERMHI